MNFLAYNALSSAKGMLSTICFDTWMSTLANRGRHESQEFLKFYNMELENTFQQSTHEGVKMEGTQKLQ